MTQEQREHIAQTIGMLDVAAAMLNMQQMGAVGAALEAQCEILQEMLEAQCEILQEMLDLDREVEGRCAE